MTVEKLAEEARGYFVYRKTQRGDDSSAWFRKDGAPDWIDDLCRAAHDAGGELMLPDDYRYEFIAEALEYLGDGGDPDDYSPEADVYYSELAAWFGSRASRAGYVDEAREEGLVGQDADTYAQIGAGQVQEKLEVFGLVLRFLQERAEELEDAEEEDGEEVAP